MSATPILRVARPSDDLDALLPFYQRGLGLKILYRFEDHDGFDGVMLGAPGAGFHFEFTHCRGRTVVPTPTVEDLVVLYIPDAPEWSSTCARMRDAGRGSIVNIGSLYASVAADPTLYDHLPLDPPFHSFRITWLAIRPGAAMIPPPGCVAEPHMYNPSIGVL